MGANGKRRPPRPRIEVVSPTASAGEAAAIVAALERFLAETAPAPAPGERASSRWQRAALVEGVSARTLRDAGWGDPSHG
ncbi:MAG TPA: hypothetical protein VK919_12110 [Solirubrobacterales bacterium]|nr:hypothetical protein [Solirubrobacterales bacterium]